MYTTIFRDAGMASTPRGLKRVMNIPFLSSPRTRAGKRPWPSTEGKFIMCYRPEYFQHVPPEFLTIAEYYRLNKGLQRRYLKESGLCTPESYPHNLELYGGVSRPMRHRSGQDYAKVSVAEYHEGIYEGRYFAPIFPKKHEYRVIYVKGTKALVLYKRNSHNIAFDEPWNHDNGTSFVTVRNPDNDRLRHTSFYQDVMNHPIITKADIIGVDIMIDGHRNYAVLETNFNPQIEIEENLLTVKSILESTNARPTA